MRTPAPDAHAAYRVIIHCGHLNPQLKRNEAWGFATYVLNRWNPPCSPMQKELALPRLAQQVLPLFERANRLGRDIEVEVEIKKGVPHITEVA